MILPENFIIEIGILWHWPTMRHGQELRNTYHDLSTAEKYPNHISDSTGQLSTKVAHLK